MCVTIMDDRSIPRGFLCRCSNPQDSGFYCEERNYCYSNPCLNGGTCSSTFNGFKCQCTREWTGVKCHTQSYVQPAIFNCFDDGKFCKNGGSCIKSPNDFNYMCQCPSGYSGTFCEIFDSCSTFPCLNNGVCINKGTFGFECNCTLNFYGKNCENLNPCTNQTCSNRGDCRSDVITNSYACFCDGNYAGKNCNQCRPQFTGQYCDQCIPGYTGPNCDILINLCSPNPCLNGMCSLDGFTYKCSCAEGSNL